MQIMYNTMLRAQEEFTTIVPCEYMHKFPSAIPHIFACGSVCQQADMRCARRHHVGECIILNIMFI